MEYSQTPEKFYKLMKKKKEEIKSLDISKSERNNLYELVEETIQRYEDLKSHNLSEKIVTLSKSLNKLLRGFEKIANSCQITRENLSKLERTVVKLKIQKAFDSQTPENN